MKKSFTYFGFWANFNYVLPILAICLFHSRKNVISRLRVKIFTDMAIFVDFTGRGIFRPYKSSHFKFGKKQR